MVAAESAPGFNGGPRKAEGSIVRFKPLPIECVRTDV